MLLLFSGLPATGKTTLAKKVAKKINAEILRTDVIRKEIIREPKYTDEEKEAVYKEMFSRAEKMISSGKTVILDANFYKEGQRTEAKKIAGRTGAKFFLIEVTCPEEKIRGRMKIRKKAEDASDAKEMEIYYKIKRVWEPITEPHIVVDTSKQGKVKAVLSAISGSG